MSLQTQVQGKPYKSQEAEEQRFTEDQDESNQEMQNETLVVRGKREVIPNLKDFCNAENYDHFDTPSASSDVCVESWYNCRGKKEAKCKTLSFGCFNNAAKLGFLRCQATFNITTIDNRKVNITTGCGCAQ